jgi:hypothetical protein
MAVVSSGFSYDMEVVSNGFITDISKTNAENEERLHALINDADVPGERLVKLFDQRCYLLRPALVRKTAVGGEMRTKACEPNFGYLDPL